MLCVDLRLAISKPCGVSRSFVVVDSLQAVIRAARFQPRGRRVTLSFHTRYPKVFADLCCQFIAYFIVTRNSGPFVQRRIPPPRMPPAFSDELAALRAQVLYQLTPLHTAIGSS